MLNPWMWTRGVSFSVFSFLPFFSQGDPTCSACVNYGKVMQHKRSSLSPVWADRKKGPRRLLFAIAGVAVAVAAVTLVKKGAKAS